MSGKLKVLSLGMGLAIIAALFVFSGCSNQSPLQPETPQSLELARSVSGSATYTASTSELITSSDGGTISIVSEGYNHEFVVDPSAVKSDVVISVKASKDVVDRKACIVFEFGPDGLVFDKPASLKFSMGELDASSLSATLYYFDPKLGQWVSQGSTGVTDGVATFSISHFSKYAIGD